MGRSRLRGRAAQRKCMQYPLMFRLGQKLHGPKIDDVPAAVEAELSRLSLGSKVKPGATVAVTCGCGRIANYAAIIKAVIDHFKQLKASPFLVPAMGSHGAGTAEGHGDVQSGLLEMIAIGLGNLDGAQLYHMSVENCSFEDIAHGVHKVMLKKANLLAGLIIGQHGHQRTARVLASLAEDFAAKERAMLPPGLVLFPRLPFKFVDILLVDEIGPMFGSLGADS